ncbi:MAG: hypothetical protein ACLT4A_15440 [Anaerobutyricum soehngenii]|jgi:hypothetical protein
MSDLVLYGNYYKMFNGNGGIPEKITVVEIKGDSVTFIRGHYTEADFAERGNTVDEAIYNMCLQKSKCNEKDILRTITPGQKQLLDKEDRKIKSLIESADKALEEFKD